MTRSGPRVRHDSQAALGAACRFVAERLHGAGCPEPYALAEQIMRGLLHDGWRATTAYVDDREEHAPAGDPATNRAWREGRERARLAREAAERVQVVDQ